MNGKQQQQQQQQQQQGRGPGRRRQPSRQHRPADIFRTPPPLPDLEPVHVPDDPAAMIRSLGEPPMNAAVKAGGYFAAVVERVSGMGRLTVDVFAPNLRSSTGDD